MSLSPHVSQPLKILSKACLLTLCQADPDELISKLYGSSEHTQEHRTHLRNATSSLTPYFSRYVSGEEIPRSKMPQGGAPAEAIHRMLKDEIYLDGRPNLSLASFVGTYMEREAEAMMVENLSKNMSDADWSQVSASHMLAWMDHLER